MGVHYDEHDTFVVLDTSGGPYLYGPFGDRTIADDFAAFVSAEIDPARVVPAGKQPVGIGRGPIAELLTWWAHQRIDGKIAGWARVDAQHQPRPAQRIGSCDRHGPSAVCDACPVEDTFVCINPGCYDWPCRARIALDGA